MNSNGEFVLLSFLIVLLFKGDEELIKISDELRGDIAYLFDLGGDTIDAKKRLHHYQIFLEI